MCVCACVSGVYTTYVYKIAGENRLVCVRKNCERIFRGLDGDLYFFRAHSAHIE